MVDHSSQLYSFADFVPLDDSDSSDSESLAYDDYSDDSDFEESFGYLNLGILTHDQVLEPSISSPPIEITSTLAPDDACIHMDSGDSVQQDIHCLPDLVPWDDYLTDIAGLFVESYTSDLGDFIDDIHLLFGEDDPSSVVAREHADPHIHSLLDHSFEGDMIVDTLIQQLEEVTLSSEEILGSLVHVLHSSSVDPDLSFSAEWLSTHDLEEAPFSFDMGTLEQVSEIPYFLRFLPIDWGGGFIYSPLVLFLPKGRNVVLHSWSSFYIEPGASTIGVHSTLRGGYLVSLPLLLSYGGDIFLT